MAVSCNELQSESASEIRVESSDLAEDSEELSVTNELYSDAERSDSDPDRDVKPLND